MLAVQRQPDSNAEAIHERYESIRTTLDTLQQPLPAAAGRTPWNRRQSCTAAQPRASLQRWLWVSGWLTSDCWI